MCSPTAIHKSVCPILRREGDRNSAPSPLCRIHKNVLKKSQKNSIEIKIEFLFRPLSHLSVIVARNPTDIVNRKY
jgi:hypothetical protein